MANLFLTFGDDGTVPDTTFANSSIDVAASSTAPFLVRNNTDSAIAFRFNRTGAVITGTVDTRTFHGNTDISTAVDFDSGREYRLNAGDTISGTVTNSQAAVAQFGFRANGSVPTARPHGTHRTVSVDAMDIELWLGTAV